MGVVAVTLASRVRAVGYVLPAGNGTTRTRVGLDPATAEHPRLGSGNALRKV